MTKTPYGHRRELALALATGLSLVVATGLAQAHIVYGTPTIRQLTQDSDLVLRVRIIDPDARLVLEDPVLIEAVVVAEVLESLKGQASDEVLRFVQHGHGVPTYEKGEEVALFLQRIERSPEFARSPLTTQIQWVSLQESASKFVLDAKTGEAFAAAVRSYARIGTLPAEARMAALGRVTVELVASPQARIASSALRDLASLPDASIVTWDDLPRLEPLIENPSTPIGLRIGLLAVLESRGLVEGPSRWARLVRTTTGRDRFTAVRAAGAHPSEGVSAELIALLEHDDPELVAAAAVSLGARENTSAVVPLAKLLSSDAARVRMAAIRALGRIANPEARKTLGEIADSHPDEATRRRAAAEVRLLAGTKQPVSVD